MKGVDPPQLNARQRWYLLAAYQTDQQTQAERGRDYLRGANGRRPLALAALRVLGALAGSATEFSLQRGEKLL